METSTTSPDQANHEGTSSIIESLPTELKVMVLCHMPEISSLSSIVHACPAYHQAYLGAREEILHTITVRTLRKNDIGLLDPWTAVHAPQLEYHIPHRVEIITGFLERYYQGRMDGTRRRLTPQASLAILSLHGKFAILIAKYCKATCSKNPFTEASDDEPLPPSRSELHRLYRTLWRYEVYSKLFGLSKEAPLRRELGPFGMDPPDSTFSRTEIAHNFFGLFPIHEVEELACLQKYAREYYRPLSCETDQLVAQGPKQLYEVMTAASKDELQMRIAEGGKAGRVDVTMRAALDAHERDVNREGWQWKGMYDKSVIERVPTTGWLWASSRGIKNTDTRQRRWGYVFWDQERLDGWGITKENIVNWPSPRKPCCVLMSQPQAYPQTARQ